MASQNENTSLAEFNEGVGKFLIVLGLLFIAGFFFKAGEKGYFQRLWQAAQSFVYTFKETAPPHSGVPGAYPSSPYTGSYMILVGEYNSKGEAISMKKQLSKRRINSSIVQSGSSYLVLVGPMSSHSQFSYALNMLHKNGFPGKPYTSY